LYLAKIPSGVFFSPKRKEEKEDGLFLGKDERRSLEGKKSNVFREQASACSLEQ